ncbi:MAG: hypothetical protein GX093_06105 [Xanthomonadaceae bacterium]|nr:hypothetical protein [Xanthomonadaceae bacterium]
MAEYARLMAGLYPDLVSAQQSLQRFQEAGFRPEHLMLEEGRHGRSGDDLLADPPDPSQDALLGGVIGGALGAGAASALAAPVVFAAAPVLGPLLAIGSGALLGGAAGAAVATRLEASEFSRLLDRAVLCGYCAVLVRIKNRQEQELAERIFRATTSEQPLQE